MIHERVFTFVMCDGQPHLVAGRAYQQHIAQWKDGEEGELVVRAKEHQRTNAQNRGYHAMIQPWAQSEGYPIDDLKRDLLREVFGTREVVSPVTGKIEHVLLEPHTSKLTVEQFSELIERTLQIAAECGVRLVAPDEWTNRQPLRESL